MTKRLCKSVTGSLIGQSSCEIKTMVQKELQNVFVKLEFFNPGGRLELLLHDPLLKQDGRQNLDKTDY